MKLFCYLVLFFLGISISSVVKTNVFSVNFTNANNLNLKTIDSIKPIVYLDLTSFNSQESFDVKWNLLYPWGSDHNGTARMYPENIKIKENGMLEITAEWLRGKDEGKSTANPHLPIAFRSGAIHYKKHIKVTKTLPYWEISGDFKAPTEYGSWPAFWITGAKSWPPEIDILEFKGNDTCWQNTVTGKDWKNTIWTTDKTVVVDAYSVWHNYKLTLERIDDGNIQVKMYIDDELKSSEIKNFSNQPFWLIINMQMEGASGSTTKNSIVRTNTQYFQAKNIYLAATPAK